MKKTLRLILSLILVFSLVPFMSVFPVLASDVTTSVTVTKLANDGTTVLGEVTVTVEAMMADSAELPVYGDGVTHYYFQGPSFDEAHMWDETELVNVDSRDYGACKGTDVKDLCELAGGSSPGDEIKVKSPDGFNKMFAYEDVYTPEPQQGKLILTWYTKDAEETGDGYVSDGSYSTGMRLIFFAETLNPDGKHVFGTWDMHETLAEEYWHYYYDGSIYWPSSSGLSVKWVSDIIIYSSEEPTSPTTGIANAGADQTVNEDTQVTLNASKTDLQGQDLTFVWTFTDGEPKTLTGMVATYIFSTPGVYPVTLTVTASEETTSTDGVKITVNDVTSPVAVITLEGITQDQTIDIGQQITFNGTQSYDPESGTIKSYSWSFGDGETSSGPSVSHQYSEAGTYTVTLNVTDARGNNKNSATVTVTVGQTQSPPPLDINVVVIVAVIALVIIGLGVWLLLRRKRS